MKNKKITLPLMIVGGIVALLVIAAVILSVIKVQPLKTLTDFDTARVYSETQVDTPYPDTDGGKNVKSALNNTQFSVMHAILEGKANYGFKFVLDSDKDRVTLDNDAIKNFKATSGTYILELSWKTSRTIKVGKETVTFDRLKIRAEDFGGELGYFEVVPYVYAMIDNGLEGDDSSEYYTVDKLQIIGTTDLYNGIQEILKQFSGNS